MKMGLLGKHSNLIPGIHIVINLGHDGQDKYVYMQLDTSELQHL
jgi:hypothetical protein